jgi:inorganic pyrophosphatase
MEKTAKEMFEELGYEYDKDAFSITYTRTTKTEVNYEVNYIEI